MPLTEEVMVKTDTGVDMRGKLFVGADGLPEVRVTEEAVEGDVHQVFRPATFPAAWSLRATRTTGPGPLLTAWQEIEHIREEIAIAEREAESEEERKQHAQG